MLHKLAVSVLNSNKGNLNQEHYRKYAIGLVGKHDLIIYGKKNAGVKKLKIKFNDFTLSVSHLLLNLILYRNLKTLATVTTL